MGQDTILDVIEIAEALIFIFLKRGIYLVQ